MRIKLFLIGVFTLCSALTLFGQSENWGVGVHLVVSLPQQGFDNLSRDGEGIGTKVYYRFTPAFALRGDLAYLSYGERRNSEMSTNGPFLVTRRNESFQLSLGPQFTHRIGRITPYAAALGGFYYYHTVTTYESYYYNYYDYPYTDSSNGQSKLGWSISTGLLVDLGIGAHLDFGLKLQNIRKVETTIEEVTTRKTGVDYVITLGAVFFRN
ncbi:MAG TPA: hypothetical protein PKI81_09655 [bacterium]|nr:hypothetical protein [bacterium]